MVGKANPVSAQIFKGRRAIDEKFSATYVLDELAVERLKRQISTELARPGLKPIYQAALHHELGYLLALQRRYVEAVKEIDTARSIGFDELALALSESHIALMNGDILRSRRVLSPVLFNDLPDTAKVVILGHYLQAGMLRAAMKYDGPSDDRYASAKAAGEILERAGIDDVELTSRLDAACKVIVANSSHPILNYRITAMEGEGILFRFVVKDSIERLAQLNTLIAETLVDKFDGPIDSELSICVAPWAPEDEYRTEASHVVGIG